MVPAWLALSNSWLRASRLSVRVDLLKGLRLNDTRVCLQRGGKSRFPIALTCNTGCRIPASASTNLGPERGDWIAVWGLLVVWAQNSLKQLKGSGIGAVGMILSLFLFYTRTLFHTQHINTHSLSNTHTLSLTDSLSLTHTLTHCLSLKTNRADRMAPTSHLCRIRWRSWGWTTTASLSSPRPSHLSPSSRSIFLFWRSAKTVTVF